MSWFNPHILWVGKTPKWAFHKPILWQEIFEMLLRYLVRNNQLDMWLNNYMDYLASSCFHNPLPHTKASFPIQEEWILLLIIRMSQGIEKYSLLIFLITYLAIRPDHRQDPCNVCTHWHLIMFSHDLVVKYHPSKPLCQCNMLGTYSTKTSEYLCIHHNGQIM